MSKQRVANGPFGPIQITFDGWPHVIGRVQGAGIPTATVVPNRDYGAINLNGQPVPTGRKSHSWWDPRRKSRTRTAQVADRTYELRPTALCKAELRRNGVVIAHAQSSLRAYFPGRTIPGLDATIRWSGGVDPTDVAIGQAMAVTFGVGSPGALQRIVFFWADNLSI